MNTELNMDERICAYLDNEMPDTDRLAFEQLIKENPGLLARVERMRFVDDRMRDAFSLQSVPEQDPLAALIRQYPTTSAVANVAATSKQPRRWFVPVTLAASVCAAAIGITYFSGLYNAKPGNSPEQQLQWALNNLPSGKSKNGTGITLSFLKKNGELCRLYQKADQAMTLQGLACKQSGEWVTIAEQKIHASTSDYRPAGSSDTLDNLMDSLDASGPLSAEQETRYLQDK